MEKPYIQSVIVRFNVSVNIKLIFELWKYGVRNDRIDAMKYGNDDGEGNHISTMKNSIGISIKGEKYSSLSERSLILTGCQELQSMIYRVNVICDHIRKCKIMRDDVIDGENLYVIDYEKIIRGHMRYIEKNIDIYSLKELIVDEVFTNPCILQERYILITLNVRGKKVNMSIFKTGAINIRGSDKKRNDEAWEIFMNKFKKIESLVT